MRVAGRTNAAPVAWTRAALLGLTFGIATAVVISFARQMLLGPEVIGQDLAMNVGDSLRWLATGGWVHPFQLAGPYHATAPGNTFYPPLAAPLFLPWAILPGWTFVAIPVVGVTLLVWAWRPAMWTWPLMALCLLPFHTEVKVIGANPVVWMSFAFALGLRYRWPAALVLLKPSLLPFALVGARDRRWWITVAVMAVLAIPYGHLWLDWITALRNSDGGLLYSLPDVPLLLLPLAAWAGRSRADDRGKDAVLRLRRRDRLREGRRGDAVVRPQERGVGLD